MASKQSGGDQISGNGTNTAIYITSIKENNHTKSDLGTLADICFKSNNPLTLFASPSIQSKELDALKADGKVTILNSEEFPDNIKNVSPLSIPLSNDANALTRWIINANKAFNGTNIVVANGRAGTKTSYFEKYLGYWSNFWPKLFTGADANLSACEAVLLSKQDFRTLVIDNKITNAWQIAALAEKSDKCTKLTYEYGEENFVFGDGIRGLIKGKLAGFTALYNAFIKAPELNNATQSWTNINFKRYKQIFGVMSAVLLALMCWISFDYNITWDEPNHNTFSKDVLSYYTSFGDDTTMFDFQKAGHRDYFTNVYYGMSIDVISSAVSAVIGAENDFAVRHFINAIVGFFAILFAALVVRLFSGWLPAIITLLALVCSPSFFGHCFNNPKDIPFATGFIMALYYILKLMNELPKGKHQTKVMLAIAMGFALSIRAGGLMLFGFMGMAFFFHWLLMRNKKADFFKSIQSYLMSFVVILVAGYFIGIIMWPYALRQPLTGALTALKEFEKFSYLTYYELFEGTRQYIKPWYYEPKLIMLTAPLAIIGGFCLSILFGWFKQSKIRVAMILVLLISTLFPPAYLIYKGSYVYNGWRHFIFIYPSLAALAILGWYWLGSLIKKEVVTLAVMLVIAVSFIKPGIWSIANHPYQYMYFNEIAGGVQGANGIYELDYWNQTPREAFRWLLENRPEIKNKKIKVSSNNIQEALKTFNKDGDSVKYAWTREYEWADNDWTYAIWTTRTLSKNQILGGYWPPKGTIHEVKVDGVTVAAVVQSNNNYSHLGKKYLKKNMGDSALYFYTKAYEYNPLEEEYARGIANACRISNKTDSAILFFKKAIELRDGNYEAYNSLGEIYFTKAYGNGQTPDMKLFKLAYENFALAFKHKKNSSAPLYMGEIKLQENNAEEARNYFSTFLSTYGDAAQGYFGLARAQLKLNETDSALYNLQVAIQLDPKNPQPYQALMDEFQKLGRTQEAEQILKLYQKNNGGGQ